MSTYRDFYKDKSFEESLDELSIDKLVKLRLNTERLGGIIAYNHISNSWWDFVEKYYPKYDQAFAITFNDDLFKIVDNEFSKDDFYEKYKLIDANNHFEAIMELHESSLGILQKAMQVYIEKRKEFTPEQKVKLSIIENYIDWKNSDEDKRAELKRNARLYVEVDHVDEIQAYKESKGYE
jgi:hypothetical protein